MHALYDWSDDSDGEEDIDLHSILGVHYHCLRCFAASCTFEDCPMVRCAHCRIGMHKCKEADHHEICRLRERACPNVGYGCSQRIRADRAGHHLQVCPASAVVCTKEMNWKCINDEAKMALKRWGKGLDAYEEVGSDELDIANALNAQAKIIDSYRFSRPVRVRCRDKINKKHPIVPLRPIVGYNGDSTAQLPAEFHEKGDSSDEEKALEKAKRKKQLAMFANCWMCQYDPSSQHLHTLGNDNARYKYTTKKRNTPKAINSFYLERNLRIEFDEMFIPEVATKSDNIYFLRRGGTVYTIKCLEAVQRQHVEHHFRSQHSEGECLIPSMVVRCPLWYRGCSFYVQPLQPKNGTITLINASFNFKPNLEATPAEGTNLEDLPNVALSLIARYLSPSNIAILSQVSKTLRYKVFASLRCKAVVEVIWSKSNGSWHESGCKWSFSRTDTPVEFEYSPQSALNEHIAKCPFSDPIEWTDSKIPIFPAELLSPIVGSGIDARLDLYQVPEVLRGDVPIFPASRGRVRDF